MHDNFIKDVYGSIKTVEILDQYVNGEFPTREVRVIASSKSGEEVGVFFEDIDGTTAAEKFVNMFKSMNKLEMSTPILMFMPKGTFNKLEKKPKLIMKLLKQQKAFGISLDDPEWDYYKQKAIDQS